MKAKDLRERSPEDLRELEKSIAKDIFQNRFKNFTNRLDDTSAIKKTRRDLARVKTLLTQKSAPTTATALMETSGAANADGTGKGGKPAASKPAKADAKSSSATKSVKSQAAEASKKPGETGTAGDKPAKKTSKKTSAKGEAK